MNRSNSNSISARLSSQQQVAPRVIPVYAPGRVEARERVRARAAAKQKIIIIPRWLFFIAMVALTFGFCLTLNVKTKQEITAEQQQQRVLSGEIEQIRNDNTDLAEEIRRLQNDPATIERTARQRLNMVKSNEKVLVPAR